MNSGIENNDAQRLAQRAAQTLYERDPASQALGMRIAEIRPGYARVSMRVRPDMLNGHQICHGGLIFSLADSAFAFACNSYDRNTVAAAASIDYLSCAREGDVLEATARELWRTRRNGLYEIVVSSQRGERVALFRGRSYEAQGAAANRHHKVTETPSA